jgi:peptide-methionine (S)-S-oxide reductase
MKKNIILGGGCFWCTEAIFKRTKGVEKVQPGYIGGNTLKPTYKEICTGLTGHAEVISIDYNPNLIDLRSILEIFFSTHDPTTLNRQGNDVGTQYRSSIFTNDKEEIKLISDLIISLDKSHEFNNKIVTSIENKTTFYVAENYHHDYFENNKNVPYCSIVISPKVEKFKKNNSKFLN